jgi:hypothetical protein
MKLFFVDYYKEKISVGRINSHHGMATSIKEGVLMHS